jgi:hypothetical protein
MTRSAYAGLIQNTKGKRRRQIKASIRRDAVQLEKHLLCIRPRYALCYTQSSLVARNRRLRS